MVDFMDDAAELTVDHLGLEVLGPDECWDLVARAPVGRVAFVNAGVVEVLPVTHGVVGHRIVFRSGDGGKLTASRMAPSVAFEVDEWDPTDNSGWSVLARGTAESSPTDAEALDALGLESWVASADRGTWIEVRIDEITGRRLPRTSP